MHASLCLGQISLQISAFFSKFSALLFLYHYPPQATKREWWNQLIQTLLVIFSVHFWVCVLNLVAAYDLEMETICIYCNTSCIWATALQPSRPRPLHRQQSLQGDQVLCLSMELSQAKLTSLFKGKVSCGRSVTSLQMNCLCWWNEVLPVYLVVVNCFCWWNICRILPQKCFFFCCPAATHSTVALSSTH